MGTPKRERLPQAQAAAGIDLTPSRADAVEKTPELHPTAAEHFDQTGLPRQDVAAGTSSPEVIEDDLLAMAVDDVPVPKAGDHPHPPPPPGATLEALIEKPTRDSVDMAAPPPPPAAGPGLASLMVASLPDSPVHALADPTAAAAAASPFGALKRSGTQSILSMPGLPAKKIKLT